MFKQAHAHLIGLQTKTLTWLDSSSAAVCENMKKKTWHTPGSQGGQSTAGLTMETRSSVNIARGPLRHAVNSSQTGSDVVCLISWCSLSSQTKAGTRGPLLEWNWDIWWPTPSPHSLGEPSSRPWGPSLHSPSAFVGPNRPPPYCHRRGSFGLKKYFKYQLWLTPHTEVTFTVLTPEEIVCQHCLAQDGKS